MPKRYPVPPSELTKEARDEWHRCMRMFYENDFIGEMDRGLFVAYCQSYGRWVVAERALAEVARMSPASGGLLIKSAHGGMVANPLIDVARNAMRDAISFASQLGMTPESRARIAAILAGDTETAEKLGKKEELQLEAMKIAGGRFAPSLPPKLIVSNE